ncbi:MAG: GNAT family N-acetyltransferase [Burkholderiaceae bacterium]
MPLELRDAVDADLPGIVAIYNATIAGRGVTADLEPVSVESRLAWFRAHNPGRRPLWIAKDGDAMLGWLSFSDFYGRPAYGATVEVSIYLAESARGKGLGKMLLERAIAHAPSLAIRTLLGFIFGHNEASLRLFESHGFARWGSLPRVALLDTVERDLVIVGLRLDALRAQPSDSAS